jgi:hypothetical protein
MLRDQDVWVFVAGLVLVVDEEDSADWGYDTGC